MLTLSCLMDWLAFKAYEQVINMELCLLFKR